MDTNPWLNPEAANGRTSKQKVLQNPDLLRMILLQTEPQQRTALSRVNNLWKDELHTPSMWREQHAPAAIDFSSRTIHTSYIPRKSSDPLPLAFPKKILVQKIGYFGGQIWQLRSGASSTLPASRQELQILDRVGKICGWMSLSHDISQIGYEQHLARVRMASMNFLLDRSYRLEHKIPISIWHSNSKDISLAVPFFALSVISLAHCVESLNVEPSWEKAIFSSFGVLGAAMGMIVSGLGILLLSATGGDTMFRNIILGYKDYLFLNQWSREFSSHQIIHPDANTKASRT